MPALISQLYQDSHDRAGVNSRIYRQSPQLGKQFKLQPVDGERASTPVNTCNTRPYTLKMRGPSGHSIYRFRLRPIPRSHGPRLLKSSLGELQYDPRHLMGSAASPRRADSSRISPKRKLGMILHEESIPSYIGPLAPRKQVRSLDHPIKHTSQASAAMK